MAPELPGSPAVKRRTLPPGQESLPVGSGSWLHGDYDGAATSGLFIQQRRTPTTSEENPMIKPTNDFTYAVAEDNDLSGPGGCANVSVEDTTVPCRDGSTVAVPAVTSGAALSEPTGPPTRGRPVFTRAPLLIGIP
jgi:hypothetical protein